MSEISSHDVDRLIETALNALSFALQATPEEAVAAQADGLVASERLMNLIEDEVTTADGVTLTRDEFRRRLESEKARHAGHAERIRLSEASERLESLVLNGAYSPFADPHDLQTGFKPRDAYIQGRM